MMKINIKTSKQEKLKINALSLIHKHGFKAMTMRMLAEEMGCDVANIYNYIDSKQSLLSSLLMDISQEFVSGVTTIQQSNSDFSTKLKQVIGLYINLGYRHPYQVALLVNEWRNLDEKSMESFLNEKKQVEQHIRSIIEEGINEKQINESNTEWTFEHILASLRWTFNYFTDKNHNLNPIDLENHIYNLLINGLK